MDKIEELQAKKRKAEAIGIILQTRRLQKEKERKDKVDFAIKKEPLHSCDQIQCHNENINSEDQNQSRDIKRAEAIGRILQLRRQQKEGKDKVDCAIKKEPLLSCDQIEYHDENINSENINSENINSENISGENINGVSTNGVNITGKNVNDTEPNPTREKVKFEIETEGNIDKITKDFLHSLGENSSSFKMNVKIGLFKFEISNDD